MESTATIFDHAGRHVQTVSGSLEYGVMPTIRGLGLPYVMGEYDNSYWLYGGVPRKRQSCPVSLDGHSLMGVRPDSIIVINGRTYDCPDGGDVELGFDQPGTYSIRVIRWPYLDGEFEIENPAQ